MADGSVSINTDAVLGRSAELRTALKPTDSVRPAVAPTGSWEADDAIGRLCSVIGDAKSSLVAQVDLLANAVTLVALDVVMKDLGGAHAVDGPGGHQATAVAH